MSPLKTLLSSVFLFFLISGQGTDQQVDQLGLFSFRSTNHAVTDDFFADANLMSDTLYKTVINNPSATQIQKINTYRQFLNELSSFKRANADDLVKMTKIPGRKRRTLRKIQLNANSLKSETSGQWTLLAKFFHEN